MIVPAYIGVLGEIVETVQRGRMVELCKSFEKIDLLSMAITMLETGVPVISQVELFGLNCETKPSECTDPTHNSKYVPHWASSGLAVWVKWARVDPCI